MPRYDLYLYATNRSQVDSVALVDITIDDSTWFKGRIAYSALSESDPVKRTTISGGPHRVRVSFGRFRHDTVFTITHHTSLMTSMNYERSYLANNGLAVITIIRDGSGGSE